MQKLEGKLISELVEIAQMIFLGRDTPAQSKVKKMGKVMVEVLEKVLTQKYRKIVSIKN